MSSLFFHHHGRLAGLWALLDLTVCRRQSKRRPPALPTAPLLRRDIGLPELDPEPPIYVFSGRRV